MKMLNNVLGEDVFATSRIPIQSLPCTKMGEDDRRYAAPPPERPVQVRHPHHHHHYAEDVAAAAAERVDGVDAREKKDIKQCPPSHRPSTMCGRCRGAMAPRRKRKRTTTRRRPPAKRPRYITHGQVGGVSPGLIVGIGKAGWGITKALGIIKPGEPSKLLKNADGKWNQANGNAMRGNR